MIIKALAVVLASSLLCDFAHAAPIRVLCPGALKAPIEGLTAEFERATGHKVEVTFDIINSIAGRIRNGQPFDLAFETPSQWAALAADGKLDPAVRANIASVKWAIYVKKGAPKPNINTVEVLKQALLNARSIAYSSVQGPIQAYQARVTDQLGLTEALSAKARYGRTPHPGEVGVTFEVVMNGEAEIGFGTISEILARPALEMVAPMPPELQSTISFVSILPINAGEPAAARALVDFLMSRNARVVLKQAGLEPD
jgi:molybdate transport system substrate-binding protein